MGQRGDKKVQARDENNIKGSWDKNSHEICMGQRGDKKVQARDENNISGSWIKTVLKSVWVREG